MRCDVMSFEGFGDHAGRALQPLTPTPPCIPGTYCSTFPPPRCPNRYSHKTGLLRPFLAHISPEARAAAAKLLACAMSALPPADGQVRPLAPLAFPTGNNPSTTPRSSPPTQPAHPHPPPSTLPTTPPAPPSPSQHPHSVLHSAAVGVSALPPCWRHTLPSLLHL